MAQEILSSTPLLSPFRSKGGTFYTFSSTLNDMSLTFGNGLKMAPSKFAMLKLPPWSNLSNVQQMFRPAADFGPTLTTDPNTLVPKMIQDYMENYLQFAPQYFVNAQGKTSAEQAWWKMLETLGAIRWKVDRVETENGVDKNVYVEDDEAFPDYENVVKYLGDITMINSIAKGGRSYTEIYLYVPTEQGLVQNITFYGLGNEFELTSIPEDPGPDNAVGLDDYPDAQIKAIYDTVDKKYSTGGDKDALGLWYEDVQSNPANYKHGDFDFNCVLVYYDFWNESTPEIRKRNLYGVLFIDRFEDIGSSKFAIPSYTKFQPSALSDGNAFGFRLNLTYSNASNQVVAETAINDYDTVSMELYLDALRRLNIVTDLYQNQLNDIKAMKDTLSNLQSKINQIPLNDALIAQINQNTRDVRLLNQSYRVTNEELFSMFEQAITQAQTSGNINIQMPVGYYLWIGTDVYIISPDGRRWKWNTSSLIWEIVVT